MCELLGSNSLCHWPAPKKEEKGSKRWLTDTLNYRSYHVNRHNETGVGGEEPSEK